MNHENGKSWRAGQVCRGLVGLTLLLVAFRSHGQTPPGLVLWNQMGSSSEVQSSRIGPDGAFASGKFVAGVFGSAVELTYPANQYGVSFPFSVLPATNGCIEFWAKMEGLPSMLPISYHSPTLIRATPQVFELMYVYNDGNGNGGLCVRNRLGWVGTGGWGTGWSYEQILGAGQKSAWHHYAVVWNGTGNIPGVSDTGRKVVVYVDGVLKTFSGINNSGSSTIQNPTGEDLCLLGPTDSSLNGVRVTFDNFKIWNYTKTDFSDRFVEGAGATCALTISGTPANIGSPGPAGYGAHTNTVGEEIVNEVAALVMDGSSTRHVCTGWTGSGSVPAAGATNSVRFVITNESALAWNWRTEHLVEVAVTGDGSVSGGGWYAAGETVELVATPAAGSQFTAWNDDNLSATRSIVVPAGGASYTARFAPIPRGVVGFQAASFRVAETAGTFALTVDRTDGRYGAASASLSVQGGTAAAGVDYTVSPTTLHWGDGEDGARTFTFVIPDDAVFEGDETIAVRLDGVTGAGPGTHTEAVITIRDNEDAVGTWDFNCQNLGGGWRRLGWFGDYSVMTGAGWIWHNRLGFLYLAPDATPQSIWLFEAVQGWLWTSSTTYPFFYRQSTGEWIWYNGSVNPRWFYNMATGGWELWP